MIGADPADNTGDGAYDGAAGESGMRARVRGVARQARRTVQDVSQYLRSHDTQAMRADFEKQVREHPIATVAIGLGIGFLLGKLVR